MTFTVFSNVKNSPVLQAHQVAEPQAPYGSDGSDDSEEDPALVLALEIDSAVKLARPDGWRGVQAKELVIKRALYGVLQHVDEVERLFPIVYAQPEY